MSHQTTKLRLLTLPLIGLLGACSREVVDLSGDTVAQSLQLDSRCSESPIINEDVLITSQAQLDELAGCEEIRGDFSVQIFSGTDLSPLASLRAVEGTFFLGTIAEISGIDEASLEAYRVEAERVAQILAAGWLPSLHGLESLERVGNLTLSGIAAPNLLAFESLRSVSGSFSGKIVLANTENLLDLSGLDNVAGIASLELESNLALESLDGLQLGTAIEQLWMRYNPRLSDLGALAPIEQVSGQVYLLDTGAENLDALANLDFAGSIALAENQKLTSVDGLSGLLTTEFLVFEGNPKLTSLPEFPNLQGLEIFKAIGNAALESLSLNFPTIEHGNYVQNQLVETSASVIEIGDNASLGSIRMPSGFTAAQVLAIYGNANLTLVDLGSLRRLDKLFINGNPSLTEVGLGELQTVDQLAVIANPLLSTSALESVRTFESTFDSNADAPAP